MHCQIEQMARKRESVRHARATLSIDATKSWIAVVYEAVVKLPRQTVKSFGHINLIFSS
jgi:hypothetical protein